LRQFPYCSPLAVRVDEYVANIARGLVLPHLPAFRQHWHVLVSRQFEIHDGILGKQPSLGQQSTRFSQQVVRKRRVEKYDVETVSLFPLQIIGCAHPADAGAFGIEQLDVLSQLPDRDGRLLYKNGRARAARQGFETQRARARKQVEAAGTMNSWREPVKKGFTDPLRRRPQSLDVRNIQKATAPVSGYNTQPSGAAPGFLIASGHRRYTSR
jgi:hypothetical protein